MSLSNFLPRGLPILLIWVASPAPLWIMAILMLLI
ncbi:hypothetical protein LA5095_00125 [Roseibium album]|uniref:Uncharacterized protein n=1 Tax=Roseibium album TaxID=311410 RepID=A0A0M6ZMS0_9HYPH|nr:hypothetical protein LA5094_03842 [Roseibium album]CTQ64075.1 hypothetical protein LA5095_00125 [Roseibium album]CTQ72517.1 hypothetical protein LA5096_03266 [Roseibium album]